MCVYCTMIGKMATETYQIIQIAFGVVTMSQA